MKYSEADTMAEVMVCQKKKKKENSKHGKVLQNSNVQNIDKE